MSDLRYYILFILAIFLYTYEYSLWWLPKKVFDMTEKIRDYISGVASIFFIIYALSDRARALLNHNWLLLLGKISFSIYLIHPVLITLMAYLLRNYISPYLIIAISFTLSFPLSYAFYNFIEVPSLNFANKASAFLTSKFLKNDRVKDKTIQKVG